MPRRFSDQVGKLRSPKIKFEPKNQTQYLDDDAVVWRKAFNGQDWLSRSEKGP